MFRTEPTYYQKEIYDRSLNMQSAALFLEQGLGKSKIEIDSTCRLYMDGKLDGLLIVSNKAVAENWYINEIPKHIWNGIPYTTKLWGRDSKSESNLIQLINMKGLLRIFCCNVEMLRNPKNQLLVQKLLTSGRFKIVIDESTLIKTPSAAQSRRCYGLAKYAAYLRILSGEPAPNGPVDLYGQYKFLGIMPNITKEIFIMQFCETIDRWRDKRKYVEAGKDFTPHGKRMFEQMVGHCTFRMRKADVNDSVKFPAIDNKIVKVQMTAEQRELYNGIIENVQTELAGILGSTGTVRADVIISRLIKLHQVTSGFVVTEDGQTLSFSENPKLEKLGELLREREHNGHPSSVIVWAHYRRDVDTITAFLQARYPGRVSRVYGGISDNERLTALERFRDGTTPVLIANPQSIGHGLTLTQADTAIYYSNHYNYEFKTQSRDRIHRLGQLADTVFYIDIVAEDTIDEQILYALSTKQKFCNSLFNSEWIQRVLKLPLVSPDVIKEIDEKLEAEGEGAH